jgi:endoglucanase
MTERIPTLTTVPEIGAGQIALLEKLSNAVAVSGDESEVRKIVLEEVRPFADEVKIDAMGSVLATVHARQQDAGSPALKVMVDVHMDEVGFMLVEAGDEGLFRFETVGGIDARQLVGKPVWVGKDHVPGVIGAKPIHHTTPEERKNAIPLEALRIDLGPAGGSKARVGDRATFATRFEQVGPSFFGKALDNRLGVATLIELIKHAPANVELQAAFSVQEEVGLRGARVAAYAFNPDLAIAIDSTPAHDLPTWDGRENSTYNCKLNHGGAIYLADAGTLADPRLLRHLVATGDELGIPYQFRQPGSGGTDAGAIHKQRAGIPSISVSVPGRYAHSAVMLCRLTDWQATLALVYQALLRLPADILARPRE